MFETVLGQKRAVTRLQNDLRLKREACAYLFSGPAGSGKREAAKSFAKAANCPGGTASPDCECRSCILIERGEHPDVHCVCLAADEEITVDHIRMVREEIGLKAYEGRRKIFIIDHAHNLNPVSGNALLKTIEEPPESSTLILLSDKPFLILKTIVSRCRIIRFSPMSRHELEAMLMSEHRLAADQAHVLAFSSEGRPGAAREALREGLWEEPDSVIDSFVRAGVPVQAQDRESFVRQLNILAGWFRDVYVAKAGTPEQEFIYIGRGQLIRRWAQSITWEELDACMAAVSSALACVRQNVNLKLLAANLQAALGSVAGRQRD